MPRPMLTAAAVAAAALVAGGTAVVLPARAAPRPAAAPALTLSASDAALTPGCHQHRVAYRVNVAGPWGINLVAAGQAAPTGETWGNGPATGTIPLTVCGTDGAGLYVVNGGLSYPNSAGPRTAFAEVRFSAVRAPARVFVSAPATVGGGEDIAVTVGASSSPGRTWRPLPGARVILQKRNPTVPGWVTVETLTTDTNGTATTSVMTRRQGLGKHELRAVLPATPATLARVSPTFTVTVG